MCRWAPPYFPGLESMAARKNGVYLADEDGGGVGASAAGSARPLWRSSTVAEVALPPGAAHSVHLRGLICASQPVMLFNLDLFYGKYCPTSLFCFIDISKV